MILTYKRVHPVFTSTPPVSVCFGSSILCFGSIKTPKLAVSVKKRNKNKRFVSENAETSYGSSFGCCEWKLVLQDTLDPILQM